jgi:hypothetical protein
VSTFPCDTCMYRAKRYAAESGPCWGCFSRDGDYTEHTPFPIPWYELFNEEEA